MNKLIILAFYWLVFIIVQLSEKQESECSSLNCPIDQYLKSNGYLYEEVLYRNSRDKRYVVVGKRVLDNTLVAIKTQFHKFPEKKINCSDVAEVFFT